MKSMTNKNSNKSLPVIFAGAILMLVTQGVLARQTFTVTNTNDSSSGSLSEAIELANANPGLDLIAFNIPGSGPRTIQRLTPLPKITDPVTIDGYTQPGAAPATDSSPAALLIELDGATVRGSYWGTGLTIYTRNSTVRGLVVNRFSDAGIHIEDRVGGNIIEGNYIGTDVTGMLVPGGFNVGVRIWDSPNNRIGGAAPEASNVISGHEREGIAILLPDATGNQILGNYIGTDATGAAALGNGANGVLIYEGANHNTIGPGNVISNHGYGIQLLSSSDNQIYNNNFIDNTIQAYATTGRGGNILNLEKPIGGNYWSDRMTPDADGDGFVDSPYVFTGVVDYLPWARQDGWLPTPKVYYVNAVTGYDNDNGLTLQTAFATIQRGIDSAVDGDTVIVVPARYTGAGNRDLDFRGKAITVRSIDPNDQNVVETTIIDCQGKVEEPHRGFHFHSGEKLLSVLDGFTITGGFISSTTPPFPPPAGAIYCDNSSPTIANNIILNNYAANFGAVYCNNNSSPLIISNTILDNSSSSGGGGICCRGGSSPTIVNNTISGNRAGYGAGICVWSSSPTIKGNIISNNSVSLETGHSGGGIEFISFCPAVIQNNVISGNIADYGGGIAAHNSSGPIITNNTITGNTANLGGGISGEDSSLTVLNSILWNDSPDEIHLDDSSTIDITYSDIQSGWLGTGNIHADPLFVDTANADYHLQASSPCIDSGDNSAIPRSLAVDLDGNPRIINGIVDMGAYECGIAAPPPPPPPPPTLSEALDTDLSFTTSRNADWFSQTTTSQYGGDAAQSGDISNNQESWIQTTVNGAGTVSFYWKVSSEKDFDFLEFYIDGSLQEQISGSMDWQQKTYAISTLGSHTLEWRYVKDKGTDSGSDCGWVDKMEWVPAPPLDPLSEALDTILSFTTGGNADWFSQTTTSQYGGDAAQSGDISHNQESWLQATISGAGTVSFYWKVSSETLCDVLVFYIDGSVQDRISGSRVLH
ncbi:MAG: NosD domain-containing protein [Planctomycetota bacterium]